MSGWTKHPVCCYALCLLLRLNKSAISIQAKQNQTKTKNQKKTKKNFIIKVAQIKLPGSPGCLPGCLPARLLVVEASCCICAGKPAVARCANVRPSHDNPPPYNRYTK